MKISIVIPAYNEEKLLPATLASVTEASSAFAQRGWDVQLVVCDNNSTDATAAIAREHGATVVFEPVNQISRARNTGAGAATGDWLIFIDADSQPSKQLLDDVACAIESGRYIAGGATLRLDECSLWVAMFTECWNLLGRICKWCAGSFIFVEANAFRAIGGFDQEMFVSEEIDLSRRLKTHARRQRKKMIILSKHPLLTSARKLKLYSLREIFGFMAKMIFSGGANLKTREACPIWYDGRR